MSNNKYDTVIPTKNLNTNTHFRNIYSILIWNVEEVLNDISNINVQHIEVKTKNEDVKSKLKGLKNAFVQDVEKLEKNAIWDRFIIAFFGETNAGKSTIIESLRISMQEVSKSENLNLKRYLDLSIAELSKKTEDAISSVEESKKEQIQNLNYQLDRLTKRAKVLESTFWVKWLNDIRSRFGLTSYVFFSKKIKSLDKKINQASSIDSEQDKTVVELIEKINQLKKNREEFYDGQIIGTGQQDFTQSCVEYKFNQEEKPFTLIDVPGIEGNEGKYEAMIMDAVSKAHCIFYVCSAGKLPESGTIEKIKRYLKEQTEVYFLLNERKNTYTYEEIHTFEAMHPRADEFKKSISDQMSNELGDFYKGSYSLQGLMAFCSVGEINTEDRNFKFQDKLLKKFATKDNIYSISQLQKVESLIRTQLNEMESKIINANIQKGICATIDFKSHIEKIRATEYSDVFVQSVEKEIKVAKKKNDDQFREFENKLNQISYRLSNDTIEKLRKKLHHLVDNKEKDTQLKDKDKRYLNNYSSKEDKLKFIGECYSKYVLDELSKIYEEAANDSVAEFTNSVKENIKKMQNNIQQIAEAKMSSDFSTKAIGDFDMLFSFDWGKLGGSLFSIGGMAMAGASIGSLFPGIGNVIGAILGGLVGLLIEGLKRWFGGESAESKAKRQIDEKLSILKTDIRCKLDDSNRKIISDCEENIINKISVMLDQNIEGLKLIQTILDTKTKQLDNLIKQVKTQKT